MQSAFTLIPSFNYIKNLSKKSAVLETTPFYTVFFHITPAYISALPNVHASLLTPFLQDGDTRSQALRVQR